MEGYYKIHKKLYSYEMSEAEAKQESIRRRKMMFARRQEELRQQKEYELEHSNGYCCKCFMLKPLTGICPTCN